MINGLSHITLSVSNLEQSFIFYKETLGLKPKFKSSTTVYFESNHLWLTLSLDDKTRKAELEEYTHLAFDVDQKSFYDLSDKINNSGLKKFKNNSSQGNSLYFLDPDGHKLEIHIGNLKDRLDHYRIHKKDDYVFYDEPKIRPAKLEEASFLSELALRSKAYWGYSNEFIEACRPHIFIDDQYINSWIVRVLEVDNNIVGFYSLKTIGCENRLDNLWIEPSLIKNGYGSLLYKHAVKEAKINGWKCFRLAGEPDAIAFYKKMGAKLIGQVQSRLKEDLLLPHMEMTF